jgi:demethylmenaquinone methyltransferase / 2-methoxy-6-polyprenyl-1,4-benzoquinol methylase
MGLAVQKMFDGIAGRYDFLNHFLSAGRDRAWRKKAADCLHGGARLRVLDLCGGTGDFWKTWSDKYLIDNGGARNQDFRPRGVIADFSFPMLMEAQRKFSGLKHRREANKGPVNRGAVNKETVPSPYLVRMDALKPCFKDGHFDAVICAYGMRNLDSIETGIHEMRRLLRPGGIFITLEFFRPTTLFTRFFYHGLAPLCIPFLGWMFSSRRQAYAYLVESIRKFSSVGEYGEHFRRQGFKDVSIIPCDFGISHIVTAVKG